MGALANALTAYAQPLIDQTDGSPEEMTRALQMTQLCYSLAMLPEESRVKMLSEFRSAVDMDDREFDAFQRSVIAPMIRRHQEMFPGLHRRFATDLLESGPGPRAQPGTAASAEKYPGTDRYAPCPCDSGEKYKFCCGKKGR
jgi:hypothetical protein